MESLKILLAVDSSPYSDAAVSEVIKRPWPTGTTVAVLGVVDVTRFGAIGTEGAQWTSIWPQGTRVSLLSVGEVPDVSVSLEYIDSQVIDKMRESALAIGAQAISSAKETLSASTLQVAEKVVIGDPKSVILEEAEGLKPDLIVVGSHGRRGVNRVLLGSVSEAVAAGAHCSVEIIR